MYKVNGIYINKQKKIIEPLGGLFKAAAGVAKAGSGVGAKVLPKLATAGSKAIPKLAKLGGSAVKIVKKNPLKAALALGAVGLAAGAAYQYNKKNNTPHDITSITDNGDNTINIVFSTPVTISTSDTITLSGTNSDPIIDGDATVNNVVSPLEINIDYPNNVTSLISPGTAGSFNLNTSISTQLEQTTSSVVKTVVKVPLTAGLAAGSGLFSGISSNIKGLFMVIIIIIIIFISYKIYTIFFK